MIKGKQIVVGITGGIAAYKAADLVRQFRKRDAAVDVIMTRNAQHFVTPLTFQTISCHPVFTDLFGNYQPEISHIALADKADILIIAPATANIIAKIASGLADDLLSTVALATTAPLLIAPAMNTKMWENPITQDNVKKLKERTITIVDPSTGELACGYEGKGRLAEIEDIVDKTLDILTPKDLHGERILITAGPTHEPIDPIRMLTNRSSGKMGYALAEASYRRGAEVMLVTGPTTLMPLDHIHTIRVTNAFEMDKAVSKHYKSCSIVIKAAAVSDYRPKKSFREKVKLISQAKSKLDRKNLDLIVVNHALQNDGGFGSDSNEVTLIDYEGKVETLPRLKKTELADKILDTIKAVKAEKKATAGQKKATDSAVKRKNR
jgi:phosphopantothenoylcysteine decarboxylase/phosphopantothenate--cysteine ligase